MRTVLLLLVAGAPALAADPAKLAATIDARLAAEWAAHKVRPAAAADDATFLRRATLDLLGRVPTVSEVREFLAEASADKRAKLLARLIDSGGHARHMATFWRRTWVPQADTPEFARLADDFETWAAVQVRDNTPYDKIVVEILTLPAAARRGVGPSGFFIANEDKPETLAASATRAFLGVNLDCAQCHNHPFARWTRDQFWQTAAFFAPPTAGKKGKEALPQLMIPNTTKMLAPRLLDGTEAKWPEALAADTGRQLVAGWITAKGNPYFARNAVNRLWAHLYGTALVEPLDDLSGEDGAAGPHTKLLDELAEAFADSGFDLKFLTRALVSTKAYQFATTGEGTASDPRLFTRMPVRGLTGEQLYDSLRAAAGLPAERADTGRGTGLDARKRFAAQFHVERTVSAERSVTQALSMMNGRLTVDLTNPARNPTLNGVVSAPFLDTAGKIETLFLATLGRTPTAKEAKAMAAHVEAATDPERALGDIFWALVNSTEFNTNH